MCYNLLQLLYYNEIVQLLESRSTNLNQLIQTDEADLNINFISKSLLFVVMNS